MTRLALQNRVIVNTRPAHQAISLNQWILSEGGEVIAFPTIEICPPRNSHAMTSAITHIDQYDVAIFLSANAVSAAAANHLTLPNNLTLIAIGPGTAQALQTHFKMHAQIPKQYNSEGILEMPILALGAQKKIAIFCGEQPRLLLKQTLSHSGAEVDEIICYQRRIPDINLSYWVPKLLHSHADLIICTSLESLQNLYHLLKHTVAQFWLSKTPLLVISQKMALLCKSLSLKPTIIANDASDQAIKLATLAHFDVQ